MNRTPTADRCRLKHVPARPLAVAAVVSLATAMVIASMSSDGYSRLLHAYLLNVSFFVSIALGALFFVILQHLTRSQWSVVVRRVPEALAATMPWLALSFAPLALLLLAGESRLYLWNDPALREVDPLIGDKAGYLNAPFFVLRTVFYFAVWTVTARYFWRRSLGQDSSRDAGVTVEMQRRSGPALAAFAVTVCFAAFDWLMSLDPHWFSSIFGIYFFSGAVVGFLAVLTLSTLLLERLGPLQEIVSTEHFHDLGKLMFGFNFFWAYIAFSQYVLIWYANIPEETAWFAVRQNGGWQWVSLLLIVGHFALPFCGLMARGPKRRRAALAGWALWLLAMHWVDLYWLVMPAHSPLEAGPRAIDLLVLVSLSCYVGWASLRVLGGRALAPVGDPRLARSLAFHNS